MPYQNNIPQPGDLLSQSQADILNNFAALQTLIDVNHVDFVSIDQGKHKFVTMPVQAAAPPVGAFLATEVGFYNFVNPDTTAEEVYVHTSQSGAAVIAEVPLTASNQAITGWCYLPSGLILKWGDDVTVAGIKAVILNGVGLGPNFTNVFNVQLTQTGVTASSFLTYTTPVIPTTTMTVRSSIAAASFNFFVIGN